MKNCIAILLLLCVVTSALLAESPTAVSKNSDANHPQFIATKPLTWQGDLASKMVDGVDRFLLEKIEQARDERADFWAGVDSIDNAKAKSALTQLKHILGLRDKRPSGVSMELQQTLSQSAEVHRNSQFRTLRVRWPALNNKLGEIHGEGLMLVPVKPPKHYVVAIPDCDQTPGDVAKDYASQLAANGCCVVIPSLISRRVQQRRQSKLTNREYLYRSSFELGRQLAGYELQKVLAAIDWMDQQRKTKIAPNAKIGVIGWGEGGRLALFASGLDGRLDAACVSGYFGPRENVWQEPLDRNVFGLLNHFGDAELVRLAVLQGAKVIIDPVAGPIASVQTQGGAPYELTNPTPDAIASTIQTIDEKQREHVHLAEPKVRNRPGGTSDEALKDFASHMQLPLQVTFDGTDFARELRIESNASTALEMRQLVEIERYNQALLTESPFTRATYFKKHDHSNLEKHAQTIEQYRDAFRTEVIGEFEDERLP